ncbi:MAG: hypothetical protein HUJ67_03680 [Ruminiclostridium sp.]|nr:hypothetical protein [Ruminiclostridium sp.]
MLHIKKWIPVYLFVFTFSLALMPVSFAFDSTEAPTFSDGPIRVSTACEQDSAVISNDIALMNYDGETVADDTIKTPTCIINETSTPLSIARLIDNVVVIKGSTLFTETGVGAHYYAFSGYSNSYSEAFANIKLPTGFNNNNGARNGYIALGITGSLHGIDLGLRNTGSGWHPCVYDVGVSGGFTTFTAYTAPSTATNAIMTVKPVNTTTVHLYIQFVNASGNNVGLAFDRDISISSGNLVSSNNKIMCRYYRFASLVPVGTDNQSDGTYMTGGQITNCQLYNGSNYVSWGISTARVTNAWKVSSSKISLSYTTYNDIFAIQHS